MSLVGKVIKHHFQGFLVLEELDEAYVGFYASGASNKSELEEVPKAQLGEPEILADSMDAFVVRQSSQSVEAKGRAKYVGRVCLNINSTPGIVTEYRDGVCYGVTFCGVAWEASRPVVVARHLVDYLNAKVRKAVENV
jgi:hypothetical protein